MQLTILMHMGIAEKMCVVLSNTFTHSDTHCKTGLKEHVKAELFATSQDGPKGKVKVEAIAI
jgi:hypothetical protein